MSEKAKQGGGATALAPAEQVGPLADRCRQLAQAKVGEFYANVQLAQAVQEMRSKIRPLVKEVRPLAGTAIGFKMDRPDYPDDVLTEAMIEAMIRGVRVIGNEFNVISGRCYVTKEGYTRLVAELDGLSDLHLTPGVPKILAGGAIVPFKATWKMHGKPMSMERDIAVRLNNGMGTDGAIGKATRKMLAAIHGRLTGSVQSLSEENVEDLPPAESQTDALAGKLAARVTTAEPAGPAEPADAAGGTLFGGDPQPTKLPD